MRRQLSLRTKFLAGANEASAKDGLPVTVGDDARSEWVAVIENPLGQCEAVWLPARYGHAKHRRHTLAHAPFGHLVISAHLDVRFPRLGHLLHHRYCG